MLDAIPTSLTAGESVALRLSAAGCPASQGWVLRWLVKDGAVLSADVTSTPDEDAHLLALSADASAQLPARELQWQLWAAKASAGLSQILGTGRLRVLAGVTGDGRTSEERILADLRAAMERLAQDDEAEVQIYDRKIVFKDTLKLQQLIDVYSLKVRAQRGLPLVTLHPVRLR